MYKENWGGKQVESMKTYLCLWPEIPPCTLGSVENINIRLFIYGYIFFLVLCGIQNGEIVIFTQGDHLAGWNLS